MFEGSLVESRGLIVSPAKRWTTIGSAMVQCAIAALLVAIPLTHPQFPALHPDAPRLIVPPSKPPVVRVQPAVASSSTAVNVPSMAATVANTQSILSRPTPMNMEPGPPMTGIHMGDESSVGSVLAAIGTSGPAPNVSREPTKTTGPVKVSSGVSAGMLLSPIRPIYPAIAKATGTQGAVVVEAMISKTGKIESLRVVSGLPMLRQAALDAVQVARYKPYELNGEPTEVQTTITINFQLGG
jgi:protein TonB